MTPNIIDVTAAFPLVKACSCGPDDAECEHHHHRDRRPAADPSGQVTGPIVVLPATACDQGSTCATLISWLRSDCVRCDRTPVS
jgi:hypothetical protein